ncbi:MAG TPA: haloacid dehalogenase-like hydrolase [Chloroflexota bacterium]|nr:haloacid dehalogenase-like hydrolase [Chloroflexota bacterium]
MNEAPPLVVDLDGTLTARGTIYACLCRLARERPWELPRLLASLVRGRAVCKDHLAHLVDLAPERLPYRPQVLAFLRAERARGRRLILATATPRRVADAVARHLELFEVVLASDRTRHLVGAAKRTAIREAVRGGAFDYMGDKPADLPIFQAARLAILVHPSKRLLTRAQASCRVGHVFD